MGEEKPDEELMGKRKSSPRLSTTFIDVDTLRIASRTKYIHSPDNFFFFLHDVSGTMRFHFSKMGIVCYD